MALVDEIADLFEEVRATRRRLTREEIPADSPASHYAALARAERGTDALTKRVMYLIDLWTLIAGDQLASMGALLRARDHLFALFPLALSIIEHSVAVIWVLDPSISLEKRCARAALAMDRSNEQLVQAAKHLGRGREGNEVYRARREVMLQLRSEIRAQFPNETDLASSPNTVAGEQLLRPTESLRHYARTVGDDEEEWEGIYDYLCAVANHPTLAAFEFFGEMSEGGYVPMMSDSYLDRMTRSVLAPHLQALQAYAAYCLLDQAPVEAVQDRARELFPDP